MGYKTILVMEDGILCISVTICSLVKWNKRYLFFFQIYVSDILFYYQNIFWRIVSFAVSDNITRIFAIWIALFFFFKFGSNVGFEYTNEDKIQFTALKLNALWRMCSTTTCTSLMSKNRSIHYLYFSYIFCCSGTHSCADHLNVMSVAFAPTL